MIGMGTLANTGAIVVGGLIGLVGGRRLSERYQKTIVAGMAMCVMFVGIAGTLKEMLQTNAEGRLVSHGGLMLVVSIAVGAVLGEWWNWEEKVERFAVWIRRVTHNEQDGSFINAFVTSSLTMCVGAMAIVGSIEDGLKGDASILYLKAVMDGVITIVFVASLGKGAIFAALPIFLYQGGITLCSRFLVPVFTPTAMSNLSCVGYLLIFCVGWNLIHTDRKIRVANLLPSLFVAILWALIEGALV